MALIPPFFIDCVVAIGTRDTNGNKHWIGTGFLVGRHHELASSDGKQYHLFLITNKHVLADTKSIIVRFNPKTEQPARDYDIDLTNKENLLLVEHPKSEIDVVAIYINPEVLKRDQAKFSFFALDEHTLSLTKMREQGATEGDFVYVLGFPLGIVSPERQYVIVRSGSIARIRDVVDQHSKEFLIDANIFPGNSGGPVILKPEIQSIQGTQSINTAALIGIITSYIPYRDVAISQQTKQPKIIFEENSGLAAVLPTDFILDVVEKAFNKLEKRSKKEF